MLSTPKNLVVLTQGAAAAAVILITGVSNALMSPVTSDAAERHPHLLDPMPHAGKRMGALIEELTAR